jgi:hypothetical protein
LTWVKCCGSLICFNINIITLLDEGRYNSVTGRYTKVLMFQQYVWKNLLEAVKGKQSAAVMQILGCDENHPFSCLGLEEWYEFQEMAEYKCSGEVKSRKDGSHFSLGMFPQTAFFRSQSMEEVEFLAA